MVMGQAFTMRIYGTGKIGGVVQSAMTPAIPYDGVYAVTPSDQQQVLRTKNTKLLEDVVIDAIPSGYGKIEWDGVKLRIF